MLIDTHCHLDFPEFDSDRDSTLQRAKDAGVDYVINVGSGLENSRASVALSKKYPSVFASVGIHPHDAKDFTSQAFKEIKELAQGNNKVVAIGEVGLDFYPVRDSPPEADVPTINPADKSRAFISKDTNRTDTSGVVYRNLSDKAVQEQVFRQFIHLARESRLPLIIHSRLSQAELLSILRQEQYPDLRAVVHCFSADKDFLKQCLDLGFYVSFTCNLTYKKADNLRQILKLVPQDRLLLETDAPFLPPEGFRGRRNEPYFVKVLAQAISEITGVDFNILAETTTTNAQTLFNFGSCRK